MTLESVLYYCTHHSEAIIQWLFFGILLLSAFVIARSMFGKREAVSGAIASATVSSAVFADGSDIQTFLKKILDQTTKLEGLKLEGLAPAAVGDIDAQVQALKRDLASREDEIAKLKAAGGAAAAPSVDADKLSSRIKELETKLAEYEILEDDIADLSLYKEENVRLRTELDRFKAGAAVNVPGGSAPAQPAAPPADDLVAELNQAVNPAAAQPSAVEMPLPNTGDPMADFEQAVNLEKKLTGGEPVVPAPVAKALQPEPVEPAPASVAEMPSAPEPVAAAAPAPSAAGDSEGDDLFAEFVTPQPEEGLDTDKMMEEMAALVSMEPAKGTALHEEMDTDKLAAEATRLTKS